MKTYTSSGTPVWIEGNGPSVVLVHGVLMDHRMWAPQVAALRHSYRLLAIDMLGHGAAPNPPGERALADFVGQVRETVAELCPGERPVVVGFSMGGLVAQAIAMSHDVLLRGLVLLSAVYRRSEAESVTVASRYRMMAEQGCEGAVASARERWFNDGERAHKSADVDTILSWIRDGDFTAKLKAHAVFAVADSCTAGRLSAVEVPTLVMTGGRDGGSTPAMAQRMATELKDAELHVLDGQHHMMPFLDAERVNERLAAFLARLD